MKVQPYTVKGYVTDLISDEALREIPDWQLDRELTRATFLKGDPILMGEGAENAILRHKGRIRAEIVRRRPNGIPS